MARRLTVVVLLGLTVALGVSVGGGVGSTVTAQRRSANALDLAAMTLVPSDADEPGYGIADTRHPTLLEFAEFLNLQQEGGDRELAALSDTLTEAGWRQSHLGWIGLPSDVDPDIRRREIYTSLTEFADADGAEVGFALLTEVNAAARYEEARNAPAIGDESAVTRRQARQLGVPTPVQELDIVFRIDAVVAEIDVIDLTDDAPPTTEIAALAETLAGRIEAVQEGSAPDLSVRVVRIEGEGVISGWDYYRHLDGELFPIYGESSASIEYNDDFHAGIAATDVFYTHQRIPVDAVDESFFLFVDLYRFEDEEAASAWVREDPRLIEASGGGFGDVEMVDDAERFGDESTMLAFSVDRESGSASSGYLVYLRVGDTVAFLRLDGVPETPLAAVEALAAAQADCLAADECLERLPVPETLGGEAPEPDEEATEAPTGVEALSVRLREVGDSGVRGTATLTPVGRRTRVELDLRDTEEGLVAVIHEGTCDDLVPEAAFDLRAVDEDGASTTTVRVSLEDLLADEHAIAIYENANDLDAPLACGEITD